MSEPGRVSSDVDGYTPVTVPYHVLRDLLAYGWEPEGESRAWAYRRARDAAREALDAVSAPARVQ